jgi:hypothetical protein
MTLRAFKIPLLNEPQKFAIDLNGKPFIMTSRYNPEMPNWNLSMQDGETEEFIFTGLPLVTGLDLLSQFAHLGIEGSFIVFTDGDDLAIPTELNLGVESNLYYLVEQE